MFNLFMKSLQSLLMASYKLIREEAADPPPADDVESALQKFNSNNHSNSSASLLSTSSSSSRLVSLDIFRGLTVVLMIIVDDAGGFLPSINHSPWNGLTLADFVMPFFLFMVGMSLGLVYKKNKLCRATASRKATCRAVKLIVLGIFLQGGYFHGIKNLTYGVDMEQIRWMGILQRIGVAYWVAAMCEIWFRNDERVRSGSSLIKKFQWHWIMVFLLTSIYLLLSYTIKVPDWEYQIPYNASSEAKLYMVKCGVRGDTGPACNAAGMIDRKILGVQHLYWKPIYARTQQCSINSPDYGPLPPDAPSWCQAPFDPEGCLSTVMAIVTCLLGLQFGHVIVHFKDHKRRLMLWLAPSLSLIVVGMLFDICGMHINKALYSFSYMCVSTGVAGIILVAMYLLVDVYEYRRLTVVLEWMGMNALLIYILVACNILPLILQGFYWRNPSNNILSLIGVGKHKH